MSVLLTGAAGFIGSQVAESLLSRGADGCTLDYYAKALPDHVDVVVHLAARAG